MQEKQASGFEDGRDTRIILGACAWLFKHGRSPLQEVAAERRQRIASGGLRRRAKRLDEWLERTQK